MGRVENLTDHCVREIVVAVIGYSSEMVLVYDIEMGSGLTKIVLFFNREE